MSNLVVASQAVDAPVHHLLTLQLAGQLYALPLEPVMQIVERVNLLPLPQSHPAVPGMITVRGRPAPVVDARRLLGLPDPLDLDTPFILLRSGEQLLALVVDAVQDVIRVSSSELLRPADVWSAELPPSPMLAGLARVSGELIPVLGLYPLLTCGPDGPELVAFLDRLRAHLAEAAPAGEDAGPTVPAS